MQQNGTDDTAISDHSPLTAKQLNAAWCLAQGDTMTEVASELKLSRSTIHRWNELPEFREEVVTLQQEIWEKSRARREGFFDAIIDTLYSSVSGYGSTENAFKLLKLLGPKRLFGEQPLPHATPDMNDMKKT